MIDRIVHASFRRPLVAVLLTAAGVVVGIAGFLRLPRDVFPDLSAPVFNVIVQNPSMGPEELEASVAIPLEVALAGLPEIRRIRSNSQLGVSQVTVEFEPDADGFRSRQYVTERVAQVTPELPPGTEAPLVSSLTGRLNEIFEFTLEAEPRAADLMTLRDLAEFEVKNRLLAVPGVAAVERLGGYLRQLQVQLDPERMATRGVTIDEVMHAVEGANVNAAGGFIVRGPIEWTVRVVGRPESAEDLRGAFIATRGTAAVLLGDVAEVREAPAVRRGIAHRLAGEVVSCRVAKQFGADTVKVAAGIRQAIEEIRRTLPAGVELRIVYDQSELIDSALGGVGRAVTIGGVLVVFVLFLMLGNVRLALVVTLTIPLSLALSGGILSLAGIGLNTMTLGGLAIAVGLLVDAAIIVAENVAHRAGRTPGRDGAANAAAEVGRPIAFATLIVVAVFLPLFGMTGIEGRMYQPLAAAVVAAVSAALALALTIVPVASGFALSTAAQDEPRFVRAIKRAYAPLLDRAMRHAGWVRLFSLAITIPAVVGAFFIGTDFMPPLDEGAFLLQTILPPEASLEEVDRLNHKAEDVLRTLPEVEDVVRRTGRAERTEDPMPHVVSDVLVVLKRERGRSLEELEEAMRERLASVPALSVLFTTPLGMRIDEGLGGTPADISVRIFGPDLDELARLAENARETLEGVDGLVDLRVERQTGLPQIRITLDRPALARAGLTPGDVLRVSRIALAGVEEGQLWVGQRRYDLVIRLQDRWRSDVQTIRSLLVDDHAGNRIPLGQLANFEEIFAPGAVRREAGSRRIAVEGSVAGRDLGSVAEDIRVALARLRLPTGYFFDVGGRVESQERASRSLAIAIVIAILIVFILLLLALGSVAETLVILLTLPDAFVGAIIALMLSGGTWNVSSLVGLIGLFGIAVQNGLVLVTQTRALLAEGMTFDAAIREASIGRVRPKLMTASCAILGLLPLLVLRLHGTEIERPLAIVMIGGLVTSTIFTLLALPTFYALVHAFGAGGVIVRQPRVKAD